MANKRSKGKEVSLGKTEQRVTELEKCVKDLEKRLAQAELPDAYRDFLAAAQSYEQPVRTSGVADRLGWTAQLGSRAAHSLARRAAEALVEMGLAETDNDESGFVVITLLE